MPMSVVVWLLVVEAKAPMTAFEVEVMSVIGTSMAIVATL